MSNDNQTVLHGPPPSSRLIWQRRLARWFVLYVLIPYLTVTVAFVVFQRRLLYRPTQTERLLAKDVARQPGEVVDVTIHAANGVDLHGWRFAAERREEGEPSWVVLYFPGNAGCRRDRIEDCREMARWGCAVWLFDYRGFGDSVGSPSESSLTTDARRAWVEVLNEERVSASQIVLFGESLGGSVATRLAAEMSLAGTPPAALILNSTFASLKETVTWHYSAFPFGFCLWDQFPSVKRMPHVVVPVLQFHGTDDTFVPLSHGKRLFDVAPATSANGIEKRFVTVEGGQHNAIDSGDMHREFSTLLSRIQQVQSKDDPSGRGPID